MRESPGNHRNSMTKPPLAKGGQTGHADRPISGTYSAGRPPRSCTASCTAFSSVRNRARSPVERRATIPVQYHRRPNRVGAGPGALRVWTRRSRPSAKRNNRDRGPWRRVQSTVVSDAITMTGARPVMIYRHRGCGQQRCACPSNGADFQGVRFSHNGQLLRMVHEDLHPVGDPCGARRTQRTGIFNARSHHTNCRCPLTSANCALRRRSGGIRQCGDGRSECRPRAGRKTLRGLRVSGLAPAFLDARSHMRQ